MKAFLSEYGITIVVATVIMGLIGTATFFKNTGGNSLKAMTNNFLQEAQLTEGETTPPEKPTPTVSLSKNSVYISITGSRKYGFINTDDEITVTTNSDGAISVEPLNDIVEAHYYAEASINGNTINFSPVAYTPGTHIYTWVVSVPETDTYKANSVQVEVETYIAPSIFPHQD